MLYIRLLLRSMICSKIASSAELMGKGLQWPASLFGKYAYRWWNLKYRGKFTLYTTVNGNVERTEVVQPPIPGESTAAVATQHTLEDNDASPAPPPDPDADVPKSKTSKQNNVLPLSLLHPFPLLSLKANACICAGSRLLEHDARSLILGGSSEVHILSCLLFVYTVTMYTEGREGVGRRGRGKKWSVMIL